MISFPVFNLLYTYSIFTSLIQVFPVVLVGVALVGVVLVMGVMRGRVISSPLAARTTIAMVTATAAMATVISMVMVRVVFLFAVPSLLPVSLPGLGGVGVVRHAPTWVAATFLPT